MSTNPPAPKIRSVFASSMAALYAAGALMLTVLGIALWRRYCEGFGCIGKGIAWFACIGGYAVAFGLGYVALRASRGAARHALQWGLWVQAAAGVGLIAYWAVWRSA